MEKKFYTADIKSIDIESRTISGYASTADIDRDNDIIAPEAFKSGLQRYLMNPVLLLGHRWYELPIGKVLEAVIDEKGLKIKAYISETAEDVWKLIKEGILRAFSIGFQINKYEFDEEKKIRTITDLELYEVSLVNVPANPNALVMSAAEHGIELKSFVKIENKEAIKMDELKTIQNDVRDAMKVIADLQQEAIARKDSEAELKELIKKQSDLLANAFKALEQNRPQAEPRKSKIEFEANAHYSGDVGNAADFKSMFINQPTSKAANLYGCSKDLLDELHRKHDDLLTLGAYFKMTAYDEASQKLRWVRDPSSLKTYQEYKKLVDRVKSHFKAMDTSTAGEGYEWLPTAMSATLVEGLQVERGVIRRIPRFSQPTKSFVWPMLTSHATAYKKSEATADSNATTIILSTPGTSNITFTAKGVGAGVIVSREESEDSIVAIMPFLRNSLATAIVNGEENAIINGDDSTTHQDTDIAAASASHICKIFKGLRYLALNGTSATYDCAETTYGTAAFEYGDLLRTMEKAGQYALAPGRGFFITSLAAYFKMLAFSQFTGYDVFSSGAVAITGRLPNVLGCDVVPSAYMRQDLNNGGVNGASGNSYTGILYVHPDYFLIGDRRIYTVETDRMILTDQDLIVATERIDFQKMAPSTHNPVTFGYKITT